MRNFLPFLFLPCLLIFTSCLGNRSGGEHQLVNIQLIDRNGINETISSKERLATYQKNDFLAPQPYKKVVRVFGRDSLGRVVTKLTQYHPNGNIAKYLEVRGGRANGKYMEWHENGVVRVHAHVTEGIGEISARAAEDYIFDGEAIAYDEKGNIQANIPYANGILQGLACYYHPNGEVAKTIPYETNCINGTLRLYNDEGQEIGMTEYSMGVKNGLSHHKGDGTYPKFVERYTSDLLIEGSYYDFSGKKISTVEAGKGVQTIFDLNQCKTEISIVKGKPEGKITLYQKNGEIASSYILKNGQKCGEEKIYYPSGGIKATFTWYKDNLVGKVVTYFSDGNIQSEKEMKENKKHGQCFAWYQDGSLMLAEIYEKDKLMQGTYLKMNQKTPVSVIKDGTGVATIYEEDGTFVRRTEYIKSEPLLND